MGGDSAIEADASTRRTRSSGNRSAANAWKAQLAPSGATASLTPNPKSGTPARSAGAPASRDTPLTSGPLHARSDITASANNLRMPALLPRRRASYPHRRYAARGHDLRTLVAAASLEARRPE
jgi:hypothetical protein